MKNFLKTSDIGVAELEGIIEGAIRIKSGQVNDKPLAGKSVALVFFNPSLRTRASMQIGVYELGGNAVILEPGSTSWTLEHREGVVMDGNKTEHLKEFVRVLSRYVSVIGVRTFAELKDWEVERTDPVLKAFARYSPVPVINLESAMHHPCQSMADMMTIREKLGTAKKKVLLTWAWHPKPLPMAVPNSFGLAAAQFGHDLRIALHGDLLAKHVGLGILRESVDATAECATENRLLKNLCRTTPLHHVNVPEPVRLRRQFTHAPCARRRRRIRTPAPPMKAASPLA